MNGRPYIVMSGATQRAFSIYDLVDTARPQRLSTVPFPGVGASLSADVVAFKQGSNYYVALAMQGDNPNVTGCGVFIYNVNDPANPTKVTRITGQGLVGAEFWCSVHQVNVSNDASGNADYLFIAANPTIDTSGRLRVVDIRSLPNWTQVGGYTHPNATPNNLLVAVHGVKVIRNPRVAEDWVYVDYLLGGLIILRKQDVTCANCYTPAPLNPIDSINPAGFDVHHSWPTDDGNYVFILCEICDASPTYAKVRMYDIQDPANPFWIGDVIPPGAAASARARSVKVVGDTLLVGWYMAGLRGFTWQVQGGQATFTQTIYHHLRPAINSDFEGAWVVDTGQCVAGGHPHVCIYTSDTKLGLMIDAQGTFPSFDPYEPESEITDPVNGQVITGSTYTIEGNAHDYWSGLTGVEVSTDNGASWAPATVISDTWSYTWNITGSGCYFLRSRGRDAGGRVETSTPLVAVGVNAPACTEQLFLPIVLRAP
jgi:hypothetical protein